MTSRPDIAMFLPNLGGGGAERVFVNLAREFTRRGRSVALVLARATGVFMTGLEGIDVVSLRSRGALLATPALTAYLRRARPRVLVSGLNTPNLAAVLARVAARAGVRLVLTQHVDMSANALLDGRLQARAFPFAAKATFRLADRWIAVSSAVADDLAHQIRVARPRIDVIHNPFELEEMRALSETPSEHPWLAPDRDHATLVSIGRLAPQKDFGTALRMMKVLNETTPAKLIILGEGPDRRDLDVQRDQLGLRDVVDMPGFVENPFSFLRAADASVLSSAWEGFGNVLVESLAVGTPPVSTDCPSGPAEILGGGRWGALAPVGDPHALSDAVKRTLNDPPNTDALLERSRDFEVDRIAERYLRVLQPPGQGWTRG